MPIEIRELHIKVTAENPQGSEAPPAAAPPAKASEEKEALVRQCVEEVLRILNHKKER